MKKIFLTMAALGAVAAAAPAAAQPNRYPVQGYVTGGIETRIAELDARLEAGLRAGTIDRSELRQLRLELRDLRRLEAQYARDGLSRGEREDLRMRLQTLRQRIARAEASYSRDGRWQDRDDGDDEWNRDGNRRDGRDCPPGLERRGNGCVPPGQVGRDRDWDRDDDRGGFIDRNRDGYDDRDTNRDGRIDSRDGSRERDWDRDDDRGGFVDRNRDGHDDRDTNRDGRIDSRDRDWDRDDDRYDDRDDRRGTVGRVIDRVLGGGGLRVGQRVSGNLGAVPYEHRDHYRDGNGVYYRSDGRAIYQIDARTDVVLQIYPIRR